MMKWPLRVFHLNIRQKIVVVFALSLVAFYGIGAGAYGNLLRIGQKLHFVDTAYRLQNAVLEVRRYEKNYLLYGQHDDYHEAISYLEEGRKIFNEIEPQIHDLEGAGQMKELDQDMANYGQLLQEVVRSRQWESTDFHDTESAELRLRQAGKGLVDLSLQLTRFEHDRIVQIIHHLKTRLVGLLIVFFSLILFVAVFIIRKILRPLAVIEQTTLGIAAGVFKQVPVHETHDETQAVIEGFNKMVTELEKHQKQLLHAQRLSCLGILSAGVAHQLNNPLNNVSTSCQILIEEMEEGDRQHIEKLLTNINQETDRARDIVKGLLDFSRDREFQPEWVNLQNLVIRTIQLVSSQLPAGVDITSNVPEDFDVLADGPKLQEALLNLLINAAQAMGDGTGQIHISANTYIFMPDIVEIKISDTGPGIPAENISRIFDPFFSTKEAGYGTGLGLSVAYGIVEQHGGTIIVESEEGKGTTFTIRLAQQGHYRSESGEGKV